MFNFEPLKQGQQVFLRKPERIYARVIGPRQSDLGLPEDQVHYAVQLMPIEQLYWSGDLEAAAQPFFAPSSDGAVINLFVGGGFSDLAREIESQIAARAYERYEHRGFLHGHDREDWFEAVSDTLLHAPVEILETETDCLVRADVPGVLPGDLQALLAPQSVCIVGSRRALCEQSAARPVYSERRSQRIFRLLDLPCEIDPERAEVSLGGGVMELKLPKRYF